MNFSVYTKDLQQAVSVAQRCLDKRKIMGVLNCFKITVEPNQVTVAATNIQSAIRVSIPAIRKESETLEFCIDGRNFANVISKLSDDRLYFSTDEKNLIVERDAGNIKLRTSESKHFPNLKFSSDYRVKFKASEFLGLCNAALLGTNEDAVITSSFHNIAQLNVTRNLIEGKFQCSTTDTHRLAIINGLCDTEVKDLMVFNVPVSALRVLLISLRNETADVELDEVDTHIYFKIGESINLSFLRIAADFPNLEAYQKRCVFDRTAKLDADVLKNSLELVATLVDPNNKDFQISLNGCVELHALSADAGEIREEVTAEIDGEPFTTAFNMSYILPLIRQMSGDIELQFRKDERPDGKGGTVITYPLRIVKSENNIDACFDVQARKL